MTLASSTFLSHSAEETIQIGRNVAAGLTPPVILLLTGDLGSGKTTLAKGLISGLGAAKEEDVTSPTFTMVHVFNKENFKIYHVDLYRVDDFRELETLALEDALSEPAIVIIEWPQRFTLRTEWPQIAISLDHVDEQTRRIHIAGLNNTPAVSLDPPPASANRL